MTLQSKIEALEILNKLGAMDPSDPRHYTGLDASKSGVSWISYSDLDKTPRALAEVMFFNYNFKDFQQHIVPVEPFLAVKPWVLKRLKVGLIAKFNDCVAAIPMLICPEDLDMLVAQARIGTVLGGEDNVPQLIVMIASEQFTVIEL